MSDKPYTYLKIQFTRPPGKFKPLSYLIRKILGTKYSHVLARWQAAQGKIDLVWEAAGSSIRFLGPIAHAGRYEVVREFKIPLTRAEYKRMIKYTHKYAHVNYGRWQLVGMLIARIFRLNKNIISQGEAEQVCSEAVAGLLKYVKGWDIDMNMDVYGPDKLEKWLITKLEIK